MKEGWQIYQFGELVTFDKRFKGIDRTKQKNIVTFNHVSAELLKSLPVDGGDVKLLATGLFDGYTTKEKAGSNLNKGEVITIPTGGNANIKYYKGLFVDSGNILAVSNRDDIYLKYVWYYLLFHNEFLESCFKGTGIKHPYMPDIWELEIPVPPLSEQERIVSYLDAQFAKIDTLKANTEQQLQAAKDLLQSALKEYLTPKDGWRGFKMGDICSLSQGLAINAQSKHLIVKNSTIPLLRIKDMKNGTKEIFIDDKNYPQNCLATPEDLIYTRTGTLGLIFTGQYGIVHNNCFKIYPNYDIVDKYFYMYYVSNPIFRNNIIKEAEKTAQPDITHTLFKKQVIFIPALKEQRDIVLILDTLSDKVARLQENYNKTINLCNDLKQALLKSIFA